MHIKRLQFHRVGDVAALAVSSIQMLVCVPLLHLHNHVSCFCKTHSLRVSAFVCGCNLRRFLIKFSIQKCLLTDLMCLYGRLHVRIKNAFVLTFASRTKRNCVVHFRSYGVLRVKLTTHPLVFWVFFHFIRVIIQVGQVFVNQETWSWRRFVLFWLPLRLCFYWFDVVVANWLEVVEVV